MTYPIGEKLSESSSAADDRYVAAALQQYLGDLEAGRRPDRAALLARHPDLAPTLAEAMDGLDFLHGAAHSRPQPPANPLPAATAATGLLGDYRIFREVGRGGMGVVYEAEQVSLGRRVALKVLPFAAALDDRHLQRFKNEAQAAAHLHHTNIVPVYAVGCDRGVHYYAMQFIDGQTVADLIRSLRRAAAPAPASATGDMTGPSTPADRRSASTGPQCALSTSRAPRGAAHCRALARLGVQAADALEFAHQMGVVHRDVKPANLLVDARGHLWVTDFGLAHFHAGTDLTVSGDLLGTVRYMSPEQAQGGRCRVDHRTDVYSLGVTLYELFTLQEPFPGRDRQELLRQILTEEPRPPRKIRRDLPPELDTIILKALAKNPTDRYATAQELADDLRRFLEDQPIRARRPSPMQIAAKWAHRHRGLVRAAVGLLAVGAACLAVCLCLVYQAKEHAEASLRQARQDRAYAKLAADQFYAEFADKFLAKDPARMEKQRDFLEKALVFYERFASEEAETPAERFERARAAFRVGDIRQKLGQYQDAAAAYDRSAGLLGVLVADFPADEVYRRQLAQCCNSQGVLAHQSGQRGRAAELFGRAIDLQRPLLAALPSDAKVRHDLARHAGNLGAVYLEDAKYEDARRSLTEAQTYLKPLIDPPAVPTDEHRRQYAVIHFNLGIVFHRRQQPARAKEQWDVCLDVARKLAEDRPFEPDDQEFYADNAVSVGVLAYDVGRLADGERYCRQALDGFARLLRQSPAVPAYRQKHAHAAHALSRVLSALGRRDEAEAAFRDSVSNVEQLARDAPEMVSLRVDLLRARIDFAKLLLENGKPAEAEEVERRALLEAEAEATRLPATHDAQFNLMILKNNLADHLRGAGRVEESERLFRAAAGIGERLADKYPHVLNYRTTLCGVYNNLAGLLRQANKPDAAGQEYEAALAQYGRLIVEFPDRVELHFYRAWQLVTLAELRREQGRGDDAVAFDQEAASVAGRALAREPLSPDVLANAAWFYAACPEPATRDLDRAATLAERVRTALPDEESVWRTIGLVRLRRGDGSGAVEALRAARKLGHDRDRVTELLLALALRDVGQTSEARRTYDEACAKIERTYESGTELARIRAEADAAFRAPHG